MDNPATAVDAAQNEELLTQLKEWAAGGQDQHVPELLEAAEDYVGIIEDDLIDQLMARLREVEHRPRIWLQYAFSILPVYKKASNDAIKLKFLSYIYEHNEKIAISWKTNCNPTIKAAGNTFRAELPAEIAKLRGDAS
ncbi:hypothetical protein LJC64_00945 [Ruminococcaceae bacterium OttesenSCG-928-A11]|nr:hypothetical protein [Ruminococcaceae bacterium OttesenSCG-928-A11]